MNGKAQIFYAVEWDDRNDAGVSVPSGVYFYRLKAGKAFKVKRMLMVIWYKL